MAIESHYLALVLKMTGHNIYLLTFIQGWGHKGRLQVNSNLLNGTVTAYQVQYAVLVFNNHWKENYQHIITGIVATKQNKINQCSRCIIDTLSFLSCSAHCCLNREDPSRICL